VTLPQGPPLTRSLTQLDTFMLGVSCMVSFAWPFSALEKRPWPPLSWGLWATWRQASRQSYIWPFIRGCPWFWTP